MLESSMPSPQAPPHPHGSTATTPPLRTRRDASSGAISSATRTHRLRSEVTRTWSCRPGGRRGAVDRAGLPTSDLTMLAKVCCRFLAAGHTTFLRRWSVATSGVWPHERASSTDELGVLALGGLFGYTEHGADLAPGSAVTASGTHCFGECSFSVVPTGCVLGDGRQVVGVDCDQVCFVDVVGPRLEGFRSLSSCWVQQWSECGPLRAPGTTCSGSSRTSWWRPPEARSPT
jgi:hypothetical protein